MDDLHFTVFMNDDMGTMICKSRGIIPIPPPGSIVNVNGEDYIMNRVRQEVDGYAKIDATVTTLIFLQETNEVRDAREAKQRKYEEEKRKREKYFRPEEIRVEVKNKTEIYLDLGPLFKRCNRVNYPTRMQRSIMRTIERRFIYAIVDEKTFAEIKNIAAHMLNDYVDKGEIVR